MTDRLGVPASLCWVWSLIATLWIRLRDDPLRVLRWGMVRLGTQRTAVLESLVLLPGRPRWPHWRRPAALWVLPMLASDLLGRDADLTRLVADVEAAGSARTRYWAALACLPTDPAVAVRLGATLDDGPRRCELQGRALAASGALEQAAAVLEHGRRAFPDARRLARWQSRLAGERRLLDPAWQPRPHGWKSGGLRGRAAPGMREGPDRRAAIPGRVLHLVSNALPFVQAGYTIRSQRLARAQQQAGLDPHIVTRPGFPLLAGHIPARRSQPVEGVPHHWLLDRRPLPARADAILERHVAAAWELARRLRPAVLHAATDHRNARVALALRERLAVPVVYEVRGFLEETRRTRQPGDCAASEAYQRSREVETACMRAADHVVTLGETMRAEIIARGVPPERVTVIPNAADDAFLGPLPEVGALRDRLGVAPCDVLIGSVSTLNGYEGLDDLVRALAVLAAQGERARLLLVGEGPARGPLERLAEQVGVRDRVTFTGRVAHAAVLPYYAAIDVFAVPRTTARVCRLVTPLKPVEAMAAGRAVVVSRLPALTELVEHGVTGLTAPPEHPGGLAEVLAVLCANADLRRRLGAQARAWVARERTWRANGIRYRQLYARLGAELPTPRLDRPGLPTG